MEIVKIIFSVITYLKVRLRILRNFNSFKEKRYRTSVFILECLEIPEPSLFCQLHESALFGGGVHLTEDGHRCSVWVVTIQKNCHLF